MTIPPTDPRSRAEARAARAALEAQRAARFRDSLVEAQRLQEAQRRQDEQESLDRERRNGDLAPEVSGPQL